MKSMKTGLLAAAMVLLPGVAQADRPDRQRGFHQIEDVERGRPDTRPAPPQAERPPAPPTAPAAPSAGRSWNGGNQFGSPDTGERRAQWQAQRSGWGDRGSGGGFRNGSATRPAPPQGAGVGLTTGQDLRGNGHDRGDRRHWNGNDGRPGNGGRQWSGNDRDRDWSGNDRQRDNGRWYNERRNGDGNRTWNNGRSRWDSGRWRNDSRYDWRSWRNNHRDLFRGRYYGPRGYDYRPVYRGFYLESFFFGSSYWLSDPFQYRLPPVQWPLRWVRYYDDAVLVDVTTGEVVDVIQQFFW